MNALRQRLDDLALTHHGDIISAILSALREETAFLWLVPEKSTRLPDRAGAVGTANQAPGAAPSPHAQLYLAADTIAQRVAFDTRARTWREADLLTDPRGGRPRTSTLRQPPAEQDALRKGVRAIRVALAEQLAQALAPEHTTADVGAVICGRLTDTSPFGEQYIPVAQVQRELAREFRSERQRLTLAPLRTPAEGAEAARQTEAQAATRAATRQVARQAPGVPAAAAAAAAEPVASQPLFQWVKLTVDLTVPADLEQRFGTAVTRTAKQHAPRMELAELQELFAEEAASPTSAVTRVLRAIDTETLSLLKREASFEYLRGLAASTSGDGRSLALAYVRRLEALRAYLTDPGRTDADYQVTVCGQTVNLRALFAPGDLFADLLPVFPQIGGFLGESTNWVRELRQYVFGVRLKLNGAVHRLERVEPALRERAGASSYAYHLALLRSRGALTPQRLVALAVLYYAVFHDVNPRAVAGAVAPAQATSSGGDAAPAPAAGEADWTIGLERDVLRPLREADARLTPSGHVAAPPAALVRLAEELQQAPVRAIATALRAAMRRTTHARREWTGHVVVLRGLVEPSPDAIEQEARLIRSFDEQRKEYLAYMEVREQGRDAQLDDGVLLRLPVRLTLEHLGCYQTGPVQEQYEGCYAREALDRYRLLPVVLSSGSQAIPKARLLATWSGPVRPGALVYLVAPRAGAGAGAGAGVQAGQSGASGGTSHHGAGDSLPPYAYLTDAMRVRWYVYRYTFLLTLYLMLDVLAAYAAHGPAGRSAAADGADAADAPTVPEGTMTGEEVEPGPGPVFVTLARLHREDERDGTGSDDPEHFLAQTAKVLAQVLGVDYCAAAKGYQIPSQHETAGRREGRQRNALAALFAALPKYFTLSTGLPSAAAAAASAHPAGRHDQSRSPRRPPPEQQQQQQQQQHQEQEAERRSSGAAAPLDRLALLVVASRESDSLRNVPADEAERLSVVYGEVIEVARTGAQEVRVARTGAFSDVYSTRTLYDEPLVILDQIQRLYESGVRHILYVANSPHSTHLHVTRRGRGVSADPQPPGGRNDTTGDGLYFLSPAILARCTRDKTDLRIYPVFRERYPVTRLGPLAGQQPGARVGALYIQDVSNLTRVVEDKTQQMAVWLNLYSGLPLPGGSDGEKYHWAVSYATLLNIYGGILNEMDLRTALIQNDGRASLKEALTHALMAHHIARYAKAEPRIGLSVDPYSDVIGDHSVGTLAVAGHARPQTQFNLLAFLTEVRAAIRIPSAGA